MAIAAAAIIAAPPVVAQPMQLTPAPAETQAPSAVAPETQAAPAATSAPAAAPASEAPSEEIRGSTPVPPDVSVAETPAAPPPPPPPAPRPTPPPAPVRAATTTPPAQRFAPAPTATVDVGVQDAYTRLAFRFEAPTTVTPLLQGNRLELRFSRAADIDLAEIRANLPRYVREIRRISAAGQPVRLQLTLDANVRQRHFADGNRVVVDLLTPPVETNRPAPAQPTQTATAAPTVPMRPVNGVGQVRLVEEANVTRVTVTWPSPARAAAFRRGEAIWLVFDASGRMNLDGVARAGRRHQDIEVVQGEGVIGLRIPAQPDVQVSASANDASWTFTLGSRADAGSAAPLSRDVTPDGRGRLTARFGREGTVRYLRDPEVGDRIAVALLGGAPRGIDARRATVEAAVLPAAHGAVVETRADGVTIAFDGGDLIVSRDEGLIASGAEAQTAGELSAAMLEAAMDDGGDVRAAQPGMTLAQVRDQIDELSRRAANEGVGEGAPATARMELARFLLQNDFAAEALGALRIVAINQGEMAELDPEYRLMRAAANVMMGRSAAADADLTASTLQSNPSAALWRGYAASLRKDWAAARRDLERGAGAMEEHPPAWRARFQLALARAAFELNDHAAAEAAARAAMGQARDASMRLQARLIEARVMGARGQTEQALGVLDQLSRVRDEEVAVAASVESIRLRRQSGLMRAVDAIEPLEALRFRWRGDATELAIVGMLGEAYSELGRWREALATMRIAADRFPSDPAARQLRADMTNLFERLFLDGEADRLEPIQALGLFYEFSDLTPVGPNGDRIVRLLAGRLVHVDLLEQAAQLLQYQVDERLLGLSKAEVAADLAAIYLMDRKPDQALVAISTSRVANMPANLLGDRRILEARALLDLGRLDSAVELVERDRSEEAQRVRAEAAWRARDWDRAAAELRALLSARSRAQPLDVHGRETVLRAAVALTLANNTDGVRALYRDYAGDMANTPEADPFEVIASGVHAEGSAIRDVAHAVARTDLLGRFMERLRTRMTADAAETAAHAPPATPAPAAPAPNQPAAPPPAQAAAPTPARPTPAAGA